MEQVALISIVETGFADHSRFAAVGIGANCEGCLSVDALGAMGFPFSHFSLFSRNIYLSCPHSNLRYAVNLSVMVVFDQWKEWLINKLK